jgi:hypothetical protein
MCIVCIIFFSLSYLSQGPEVPDGEESLFQTDEQALPDGQKNTALEQNSDPLSTSREITISPKESGLQPSQREDVEEEMLQPGVPMPVSADPNVPDPTSLHTSPVPTPQPSAADEDTDDQGPSSPEPTTASAIPPALLKHFSGHKTVSGLFTPLSEGGSCSPPSNVQGAPEDVTAETPTAASATSPVDSIMAADSPPEGVTEAPEITGDAVADDAVAEQTEGNTGILSTECNLQEASPQAVDAAPSLRDLSAEAPSPPLAFVNVDADADADGDNDSDYEPSDSPDATHTANHVELPLTINPKVIGEESPTEVDDGSLPGKQVTLTYVFHS